MSKPMYASYVPTTLQCVSCGNDFVFTAIAQRSYAEKGFAGPKRCYDCRQLKRTEYDAPPKERPCYSWSATGACRYGNHCRFLHSHQDSADTATSTTTTTITTTVATDEGEEVGASKSTVSKPLPSHDVTGSSSPQSTSITITDAYERDESKYVTTPETKYKVIAPTLKIEAAQQKEKQAQQQQNGTPSRSNGDVHTPQPDLMPMRSKYDYGQQQYNKASKKMKKRRLRAVYTSDGMSTPVETAAAPTSASFDGATSVQALEEQLQNATLEETHYSATGDDSYVVTDLPVNSNAAPTSFMGPAAWAYPYNMTAWPPYAQQVGGMVYFGPQVPPQYYYAAPYPAAVSPQYGYPPAAAVMFDPSQAASAAAAYQYPMQAQSMIPPNTNTAVPPSSYPNTYPPSSSSSSSYAMEMMYAGQGMGRGVRHAAR